MNLEEVMRLIEKRTGISLCGSRLNRIKKLYETERSLFKDIERKDMNDPVWQKIIKAVSVQETYFYRDAEVFDCIKNTILPKIVQRNQSIVKIWSAGCATGEEAYTLAIIAYEVFKGFGKESKSIIQVLGTDISEDAIRTAKKGLYKDIPMGSFRKISREFLRYFDAGESGLRVKEEIRELVSFRVHNLVSPSPPLGDADLVVCRNVLIYFTDDAKERAYDNLVSSMRKGGFLVLGPLDNPGRGLEKHHCDRIVYFTKP